jgi:AraC family transcriptional regulator
MVGVYYDSPVRHQSPPICAAMRGLKRPRIMAHRSASGGSAAFPPDAMPILTFTGPYAGLPAAYDQLDGHLAACNRAKSPADSPVFEIYLNSPMDTAPADLVTELCLPLR